jgi:hypothetical protein
MGWLGEELADQSGRGLAPRTTKDLVEERLFALRNNLFSEVSLVFLDTTSLYFEGRGGESLGQYGHSKDHRPDLRQVVLAVVIDSNGRPICSELWPGNTTDVTTLLPVIERLKTRFLIARIGVVADRGMISAATVAELEARGIDYILGARERATKEIRGVIADPAPWVPLSIPKAADRGTTDLRVKEVIRSGIAAAGKPWRRRYIVCRNEAEAHKDAAERTAIVAALAEALARGDKSLVGNRGYRRFLGLKAGRRFEIDPRRVALDALFDGIYVLRTNTKLAPGRPALSRPLDGRGHLPHRKIPPRHPPDLPQMRPHHPRSRLLFLSRPGSAQAAAGPPPRCRSRARMGRHRPGSPTPERNRDRARRKTLSAAQPSAAGRQRRLHDTRRRPAAARPQRPTPATANSTQTPTPSKTPPA